MAAKIKIRRDTGANWTASNPTLADGEQGYDKTAKKMKVGDGVTPWDGLAYMGADSSFSGNYADLTNKPALFSGNYADLAGKPDLTAITVDGGGAAG